MKYARTIATLDMISNLQTDLGNYIYMRHIQIVGQILPLFGQLTLNLIDRI